MAIRKIRKDGDEVLRKVSKKVEVIDDRILALIDDMADTMYNGQGVGLAAPQVGILKRIVVIDVGDGLMELINPEIIETSGEQLEAEGCLSIPGVWGEVKRPAKVKVRAQNSKGETVEYVGEKLLAIAFCHEIDHLDGILFKDKAVRLLEQE